LYRKLKVILKREKVIPKETKHDIFFIHSLDNNMPLDQFDLNHNY